MPGPTWPSRNHSLSSPGKTSARIAPTRSRATLIWVALAHYLLGCDHGSDSARQGGGRTPVELGRGARNVRNHIHHLLRARLFVADDRLFFALGFVLQASHFGHAHGRTATRIIGTANSRAQGGSEKRDSILDVKVITLGPQILDSHFLRRWIQHLPDDGRNQERRMLPGAIEVKRPHDDNPHAVVPLIEPRDVLSKNFRVGIGIICWDREV